MKTLNRPMFRYGGPIKEGVMHGIREPKRNGGSMTQRVQPSNDGSRPGYAGPATPFIPLIMGAARAGARYIPRGINALKNLARTKTGTKSAGTVRIPGAPGTPGRFTNQGSTVVNKAGPVQNIYEPNFLGRDPTVKLVGGIYRSVTNPAVTGKLAGAARFVVSPTGALTGLYFANGRFFNKDNKEVPPPKGNIKLGGKVGTSGAPGGGNPDMTYTAPEKELTDAEREQIEADARMKKMDKYKEIMDIKGMSKDAAYKSLIDASNIIREGGNLKEGIKDGSLISKLTTAASKRFDKVGDTEAALRSLIAKGEITKEMNKEENALAKLLKQKQIEIADKSLAGKSMAEIISTRMEKGDMFQGSELASLLRVKKGIDAKVLPSGQMEQGQDPLDYITSVVATVNADETTPDYPDGVYVIKDRIIQVMDGQVIPVSINQLT
jgi:hypothetical protein